MRFEAYSNLWCRVLLLRTNNNKDLAIRDDTQTRFLGI